MQRELEDLTAIVETWQITRIPLATKGPNGGFNKDSMREFAEVHNALTKRMMSIVAKRDPEFWSAWIELGQNASTMSVGGKLIVDKVDRTNE